jgi:hypothetical protein
MTLKTADLETLQQHVDALAVLVNLILTAAAAQAPALLDQVLRDLHEALDRTPQMHPQLRELLEKRYLTFAELRSGPGRPH